MDDYRKLVEDARAVGLAVGDCVTRQQNEIDRLRAELEALKLHHDELLHYNEQHRAELEAANGKAARLAEDVKTEWTTERELRDETRQCVADNHAKCDAIEKLQSELEAAKQWGTDLSNELGQRVSELTEARRLLDEARGQVPVAFEYKGLSGEWIPCSEWAVNMAEADGRETRGLYAAAPVPAQPAFVPYTHKELREWYPVMCNDCGWRGLSRECAGGGSIADTGDFADILCPECWNSGEGKAVVPREVVIVERCKPEHLPSAVPEAVAKDAARYRWLRDSIVQHGIGSDVWYQFPDVPGKQSHGLTEFLANADAAIDAAILSAADDEVGNG